MKKQYPFKHKAPSLLLLMSSILIVSLVAAVPLSAQDTDSIKALRQMGKAFAQIAEKASPAVVGIKAESLVAASNRSYSFRQWPFNDPFFEDDFFDRFFRGRSPRSRRPEVQPKSRRVAQGSGFIVSNDGYILTNNHVVADADTIKVKLVDEREFEAKVIGTDPESEVAVIKIDANQLPTIELAASNTLEVGEWVLAIGNPFGLSHTVTAGIVSAKGRSGVGLTTYEDFIQTDAAINPGNSGGPLINLDGKVVGINTAIIGANGNIGIGFAVPIDMAKAVYEDLIEGGAVIRGFLGVIPSDLTEAMADYFGLKEAKGVILNEVTEDSAADKAGLKQGDIIIEFDGKPVKEANKFRKQVAMLKPGTKVKAIVLRDGRKKELTIELGERPAPQQLAAGSRPEVLEQLGLTIQNLTDELASRLGYEGLKGVVVADVEAGSLAAFAGIKTGTLIMEVNRQPVVNTKEFNKIIKKASEKKSILLLVRDENFTRFVALELPKE